MKKRFTPKVLKAIAVTTAVAGMMIGVTGCGTSDNNATSISDLDIDKYVDMLDYKTLKIELDDVYTIDESQVQEYTDYYLAQAASSAIAPAEDLVTDRVAKLGDVVNIDFIGYKDGVAFDGGTGEGYNLALGSHSFIDGFEDGLVGVMPGETVDLNLRFPDNYAPDLAGAEVVFTVTVNGIISEKSIIDSWNANFGGDTVAKTVDDIYNYYDDSLRAGAMQDYEYDIENAIIDEMLSITTFTKSFPESLVKEYQANAETVLENYASVYGVDKDTIAQYMFQTTAAEYINSVSYEQLQIDAALQYIAVKEGLTVGEEGLMNRIIDTYAEMGQEAPEIEESMMDNYRTYFTEVDVLEYLKDITEIVVK